MDWFMLSVLIGVALLIPTAYAGKIGAPYAPTRRAAVRRAFSELGINDRDVVVDLGAGDGTIVVEAARRGATARGYELSPMLWVIAWLRARRHHRATIRYQNFYKTSLADATVVFAFLLPQNMGRVKSLLAGQTIPRGRFFVSYAFPLPATAPTRVIREPNCATVYVYDLPPLTQALTTSHA